MDYKIFLSGVIDFFVTAGTAFLTIPEGSDITLRMIVTILVGSLVATGKGLRTYYATYPTKRERKR